MCALVLLFLGDFYVGALSERPSVPHEICLCRGALWASFFCYNANMGKRSIKSLPEDCQRQPLHGKSHTIGTGRRGRRPLQIITAHFSETKGHTMCAPTPPPRNFSRVRKQNKSFAESKRVYERSVICVRQLGGGRTMCAPTSGSCKFQRKARGDVGIAPYSGIRSFIR